MRRTAKGPVGILTVGCLLWMAFETVHGADYDPLAVSTEFTPRVEDLIVKDAQRRRDIPVRVYLPLSGMRSFSVVHPHNNGLMVTGQGLCWPGETRGRRNEQSERPRVVGCHV
jgi:hypothetical protein